MYSLFSLFYLVFPYRFLNRNENHVSRQIVTSSVVKDGVTNTAENVQLTIPPNYAAKFNIQLHSLKYDFPLFRITVLFIFTLERSR